MYTCDYDGCNKLYYDLRTLNKHKRVHTKPFKCLFLINNHHLCNKSFSNKRNLKIHARSHKNERKEKCKFCGKTFCDPSTLKNHIKYIHSCGTTPKPYVCKVCHKKFARKASLQKHLEIHLNAEKRKLFECKHCNKSFTVKSNRTRHIKKLHLNI